MYFERIHPFSPFLDRKAFETIATSADLAVVLTQNKPWSALYHAVLALGCHRNGGGSFEPGTGKGWQLFSVSLALFPELLAMPDSVTILQALAAMAVYGLNISCLSIEHVILSEGARRAQNLASATLTGAAAQTHHRTFWVLYSLEKICSFYFGRSSVRRGSRVGDVCSKTD